MSIDVFGWLRDDGTVTWDRDEVIGEVRKVIQGFKNSDHFLKSIDQEWDKEFASAKPRQKERMAR